MSREQAKAIIEKLVERFAEHRKEYHLADYNEQKARQDFINPFFKALGWDIDNEKGDSEAYREVIYEDKVVVRGKAKAPDYGFRLSGSGKKRLFYVEAKKPAVAIKTHKESAYQLRRYGSSAQAHVSILTNFEDFIVYDCSKVPNQNDSATVARLKHIGFADYVKEFDFLYDTFSHEAVTKGRFDKFVQASANKKGTDTLDKRFVESLDQWRKYLATSIALNNKKINDEELNYAVQQTIDRLIFLRFCEDRSVEPYGQLQVAASKGDAYKNLLNLFQQADDKYNSGLFDFEKDRITKTLKVDNKVIKTVVEDLYYPKCNFEFSVMPVEILGNAYEQFLGKVIRITPARGVKIEEKPEVRKAGGVYYTPQYIVDYIVKNTVGKLIDGKKTEDVEKIKIVDPACGSGSFLLGAYQYLLDWHLDFYYKEQKRLTSIIDDKGVAAKEKNQTIKERSLLPLTPDGKLTTKIKKQILVNNIYGVDLDANAVEVSKLSLLLKCMEGETEASVKTITLNLNDRVLPNLDENIKDGNSLIDTDIYDSSIDFGEEKKIKPFSWEKSFQKVFKQGGFDVVIGNPPYVVIEGDFRNDDMLSYFKLKYKGASYKIDLYHLFFEKGLKLLKDNGKLGYITPSNFLSNNGLVGLRETILSNSYIELLNAIKGKVFIGASVDTTISIFAKTSNKKKSKFIHSSWETNGLKEVSAIEFDQNNFKSNEGNLFISTSKKTKITADTFELGQKFHVKFGMQLRDRKKFIADVITTEQKNLKTKYHRACYTGKDVGSWTMNYSNLLAYFNREAKSGGCWDENIHNANPKIIVRQIGEVPICAIDTNGFCCLNTVFMIVPKNQTKIDLKFVLAVLNSKFIKNYWTNNFSDLRTTFPKIKGSYLEKLPISDVDFKKKDQKQKHDEIIKHVDLLLKLNEELKEIKLQTKIDQVKQRIEHSEDKINQLVYDLYELTPEEIAIIEGGNNE